ncbi:PfkB family carbohydrate kinase, partial [Salmonella enterica subsp. enterica serovar Kentucky]|nr:PfkB family carbohydrate kinase [Salmonella enterica subsp. enterica serovar Kentucky]
QFGFYPGGKGANQALAANNAGAAAHFIFKVGKDQFSAFAMNHSFTAFATFQVNADIVISRTRIVYPASSKDVIVNLDNRGNKPLL